MKGILGSVFIIIVIVKSRHLSQHKLGICGKHVAHRNNTSTESIIQSLQELKRLLYKYLGKAYLQVKVKHTMQSTPLMIIAFQYYYSVAIFSIASTGKH